MHVCFASKFGLSQYSKQNFTELNGVCRKRFASEHEELLMEGLDLPDLPSARNPQEIGIDLNPTRAFLGHCDLCHFGMRNPALPWK